MCSHSLLNKRKTTAEVDKAQEIVKTTNHVEDTQMSVGEDDGVWRCCNRKHKRIGCCHPSWKCQVQRVDIEVLRLNQTSYLAYNTTESTKHHKVLGQNGSGQNGIGQWYGQNGTDKIERI